MQNHSNNIVPITATQGDTGAFSELVKNCVYGICINIKKQVLATHKELQILRRCSQLVNDKPERVVYVVTNEARKMNFIVNTLIHHGVSCGKVKAAAPSNDTQTPEGTWLFVANA